MDVGGHLGAERKFQKAEYFCRFPLKKERLGDPARLDGRGAASLIKGAGHAETGFDALGGKSSGPNIWRTSAALRSRPNIP